jgi:hemerythrin-like domain-containing protein
VDLKGTRRKEALGALREGLTWLESEVRAHGRLEESVLYPALGRHVPAHTIASMIAEHSDIWWAMDLLADELGRPEVRFSQLRWHVTALVDLLRRHIDKEDNVLFLMVSQMLPDREYEALAKAMHDTLRGRRQPA